MFIFIVLILKILKKIVKQKSIQKILTLMTLKQRQTKNGKKYDEPHQAISNVVFGQKGN